MRERDRAPHRGFRSRSARCARAHRNRARSPRAFGREGGSYRRARRCRADMTCVLPHRRRRSAAPPVRTARSTLRARRRAAPVAPADGACTRQERSERRARRSRARSARTRCRASTPRRASARDRGHRARAWSQLDRCGCVRHAAIRRPCRPARGRARRSRRECPPRQSARVGWQTHRPRSQC